MRCVATPACSTSRTCSPRPGRPDATHLVAVLLANDVAKLKDSGNGKALPCMLNERGGVIDDLIVHFSDADYRIVVNAGTADKDVAWMRQRIAATGANVTRRRAATWR